MSEKTHALPKAKIEKDVMTWFIWSLPVAAVALCGWFLLHDFVFSGPTVTIYFRDADGLQEENSTVKYRGVEIGQIQTLTLANQDGTVAVRAKLRHSADGIARQGSIFGIVRPQVRLGAISGLQTIVSGNYVTVQPGKGDPTNVFVGAEEAPIQPVKGVMVTLLADDLSGIENQSEVFYRCIQVGEVVDFHLGQDARYVVIHARIQEAYAPLVRMNSQFWNAGGINAHLGLFHGLDITAESAQTLVSGGIAFATPENYGSPATNGSVFILSAKEATEWQDWNPTIPLQSMPEQEVNTNGSLLNSR
jgi:paraquat-inducible protein B